jgi:hypothetical protein
VRQVSSVASNGHVPNEDELIAELEAARSGMILRPAVHPMGDAAPDVTLQPVDPVAEAELAGAREALEEREAELREFASANLAGLVEEMAARAREVVERMGVALRLLRESSAEYEGMRQQSTQLLNDAGRPDLLMSIPDHPLRALSDVPSELLLPIPGGAKD